MEENYFAKLIRTDSGKFFVYDGLTNKIISIEYGASVCKKILSKLSKEIFPELFRRGLLQKGQRKPTRWNVVFEEYKQFLDSKLPSLVLQITRGCNLACIYCVYSGKYPYVRSATNDNMSHEIIHRSIEFYAIHSSEVPIKNISFYGGEPLLCFKEIREAVAYASNIFKGKSLNFSVSTNGTLLNREVFDWMMENPNVSITITFNGKLQDKYRRTFDGNGSFDTIMTNLTLLRDRYSKLWKDQVVFIANYMSSTELIKILKFYEQIGITQQPLFLSRIRRDLANEEIQQLLKTDSRKEYLARKALRQEFYKNPNGFIKNFFQSDLEILNERKIFDADDRMQIASCMPFTVKIFVRTDGKFNMCERTSDALILGDLEQGFYYDVLEKTLREAEQLINRSCRHCWAQRICLICFQNMTDVNGKIRKRLPTYVCRNMRRHLYELLKIYCEIYG